VQTSDDRFDANSTMQVAQHQSDVFLAHKYRFKLTKPPRQSSFRVVAVVFYELNDGTIWDFTPIGASKSEGRPYVLGANDEPCFIGGSICAERAAFVQLRWLSATGQLRKITKVVITTDAAIPISPGMLCREFMSSQPYMSMDVPIVLGTCICKHCQLDITKVEPESVTSLISPCSKRQGQSHVFMGLVTNLNQLYPFPSPYTRLDTQGCVALGKRWSEHHLLEGYGTEAENALSTGKIQQLLQRAKEASMSDYRSALHPIQYGAAVLFTDGTLVTSHQKKALEYGSTLDAVTQLAPIIEEKCKISRNQNITPEIGEPNKIRPMLLAQVDQFGIAHSPFASARAYLSEFGYDDCVVLVHTFVGEEGNEQNIESLEPKLLQVRVDQLAPQAPEIW